MKPDVVMCDVVMCNQGEPHRDMSRTASRYVYTPGTCDRLHTNRAAFARLPRRAAHSHCTSRHAVRRSRTCRACDPWFSGHEQSSCPRTDASIWSSRIVGPPALPVVHLKDANEICHARTVVALACAQAVAVCLEPAALPDP